MLTPLLADLQDKIEEVLDVSRPLEPVTSVAGTSLAATQQLMASHAFIEACYAAVQAHVAIVQGLQPLTIQQVCACDGCLDTSTIAYGL